jgi:hypothetical protein
MLLESSRTASGKSFRRGKTIAVDCSRDEVYDSGWKESLGGHGRHKRKKLID